MIEGKPVIVGCRIPSISPRSWNAGSHVTITESGLLAKYRIVRGSGNSQFDSSLGAALSTLRHLPAPPDRDLATPNGPKNLKYLATHGKLCAELSPPAK